MSYAKFDDRCDEHPKVVTLSDRDFRAWFGMVLYSSRNLTDGFVPASVAKQRWRRSLPALLAAGMITDSGPGFHLHDYLDWNDSKYIVEQRREKARSAALSKAPSKAPSSAPSKPVDEPSTPLFSAPAPREPKPKSLAGSPLANGKQAERVALKNAIVAACEWSPTDMTTSLWGRVEGAAKELLAIDADPDDLLKEARAWRYAHPDIPVTPQVLTTHFAEWAAGKLRPVRSRR